MFLAYEAAYLYCRSGLKLTKLRIMKILKLNFSKSLLVIFLHFHRHCVRLKMKLM